VETLVALGDLVERNPELQIQEYIVLDVVIGHAVRLAWLDQELHQVFSQEISPEAVTIERYEEQKAAAWKAFYSSPPPICTTYAVRALQFLVELGQTTPV
jgi:phosphorylase kinase alpha/beta subunit